MKYLYTIQAYSGKDDKTYQMFNVVEVIVSADTEKEAIQSAKKLIKKKYYRVARITENHDHSNQETMQLLQLEVQKRMLDFMKGQV